MNAMLFLTMLLTAAAHGGGGGAGPQAVEPEATVVAGGPAAPATDGRQDDRPRAHVRMVQQALSDRGFDPGLIDGLMGASTSSALRRYQRSERLPATGEMDLTTLERLRAAGPDTRMTR